MKLSNEQAAAALTATQMLAKRLVAVPVAMKIRKLGRALEACANDVEEMRTNALQQFGQKDENENLMTTGDRVLFPSPEAKLAFQAYLKELMETESEFDYSIKLSELGEAAIKPEILWGLGDLLEEDE